MKVESSFREMLPRENALIRKLLEASFPGRDELAEQVRTAKVRTISQDGCLEFLVTAPAKPKHAYYGVPVEGEYEDPDGVTVHVLLHVRHGCVTDLEFYRDDGERVQTWPDPNALRVIVLGNSPWNYGFDK